MPREILLPDRPTEYKNFNSLTSRVDRLRRLSYFTLPREIYRDSLIAYCQLMDRSDQGGLFKQLQQRIVSGDPSSQIQDAKDDYFAQLHQISAYPQLQRVITSEAAQRRYGYGLNGGPRPKFVSESARPYFDVLTEVDPRVPNWVAMYEIGIGGDDFSKTMSLHYLMLALAAEGMPLNSPEAKLALLTQLENRAKIHMIGPVLRVITRLLDPSISFGDLGERSSIVKYNRLSVLLSGDARQTKGIRPGNWVDEARSGTEYYRGYYDLVHSRKEALAKAHAGEDAPALLKAIQTVIFAQVARRKQGQTATQIWRQLAKPLPEGDYEGVKNKAATLVQDNPELFPEYIWHEFGLDNNEVKRDFAKRIREKEIQAREAAITSAMRPQMLLDKAKAERNDPALKSQVEPYIGQEVILNGDKAIVRKIGQVKERGGQGYTEMVQILYPGGRSAMISFQTFLQRLQE